jgi:hypothetical protein
MSSRGDAAVPEGSWRRTRHLVGAGAAPPPGALPASALPLDMDSDALLRFYFTQEERWDIYSQGGYLNPIAMLSMIEKLQRTARNEALLRSVPAREVPDPTAAVRALLQGTLRGGGSVAASRACWL